jgi:hypothetical protein
MEGVGHGDPMTESQIVPLECTWMKRIGKQGIDRRDARKTGRSSSTEELGSPMTSPEFRRGNAEFVVDINDDMAFGD